jgi:hypothetical protein
MSGDNLDQEAQAMPIFKRIRKVYKKGYFSRDKYETWLLKNGGEAELVLSKLGGSNWSERFDGSGSIDVEKVEGKPELFLSRRSNGRLERVRILPKWVEWRDD